MKKIAGISVMFLMGVCTLAGLYIYRFSNTDSLKPMINTDPCFSLVNGYTYDIGESVDLCLLNVVKKASLRLINLQTHDTITYTNIHSQGPVPDLTYYNRMSFPSNYKIQPKASGIYMLQIVQQDTIVFRDAIFVNDTSHKADITYILSDFTWNAYNTFGGVSNYKNQIVPQWLRRINHYLLSLETFDKSTYKLALNRPDFKNSKELEFILNDSIDLNQNIHLVGAEIPLLLRLFNKNYNIRIIDCSEFDRQAPSLTSKLFIFNGHAEYWTENMIVQLRQLKERSNILFTSGNNIFRIVSTTDNFMRVIKQESSKKEITVLLGTFFNGDGYGLSSEYTILNPVPWSFLNKTTSMGKYAVGYETDKTNEFTPSNTIIIAKGKKIPADMVYMKTNTHYLLNTSSVNTWKGLYDPGFNKFIFEFIDFSKNTP